MEILHTIELDKKEGFDITFNALCEDYSIEDSFDETKEGFQKMYEDLNSYYTVWFCAQIVVSKLGIKLGSDYLGGCYYNSYEEFINEGGYIDDMINNAIIEAKRTIQELTN